LKTKEIEIESERERVRERERSSQEPKARDYSTTRKKKRIIKKQITPLPLSRKAKKKIRNKKRFKASRWELSPRRGSNPQPSDI
jgi:hypothetical protein